MGDDLESVPARDVGLLHLTARVIAETIVRVRRPSRCPNRVDLFSLCLSSSCALPLMDAIRSRYNLSEFKNNYKNSNEQKNPSNANNDPSNFFGDTDKKHEKGQND